MTIIKKEIIGIAWGMFFIGFSFALLIVFLDRVFFNIGLESKCLL